MKPLIFVALGMAFALGGRSAIAQNLLRNSDFERLFLLGGPADGWQARMGPKEVENAVRLGEGIEAGACHVISVPEGVTVEWYTCAQSLGALAPGSRYTLSSSIRTDQVRDGAGAYVGVGYFDEQGVRIGFTDTSQRVSGTSDWVRVSEPFTVPPRTVEVIFNLVMHGHGTAFFDRVQVEAGDSATPWRSREAAIRERPLPAGVTLKPSPRGNVAIFRDDIPPTGSASDPAYLRRLVEQAGYGCAYLNTDALADPNVLTAARFDLLVLPYGASFPAEAARSLLGYCRDGGSLFASGGYPFDRLLARQKGEWKDVVDLTPDESKLMPLFGFSGGVEGWTTAGRDVPRRASEAGQGRAGPCLKLAAESLGGWVSAASPLPPRSIAGSRITAFWARADQDDVILSYEWDEKDGSRWRSRVTVTREWRLYAIPHAELEYWHDNPSKDRGAPDDFFHPENAAHMGFGLTQEYLRGDQPYAVYIDSISTGDDPFPTYRNLRLNSHHGTSNPATFLETSAATISVCDASAPVTDAARLVASPGQTLVPDDWRMDAAPTGISATGQTAQGRAGAPLKARWLPTIDCVDRYGRLRGTGLALMHNFAGEYAGTTWAYSGIDNRDLFARGDARGAALFTSVLDRVVGGAFLFSGEAEGRSIRRGERAVFTVGAGNLGKGERSLSLRLCIRSGDRTVAERVQNVRLPSRRAERLRFEWDVPSDAPAGLLTLAWELTEGARLLDRLEAGAVVWDTEQLAAGPRLAYGGCYFSTGRGPEFLLGTQNYWGNGTVTGTDPLRWDRQFAEMADSGIHTARSFMSMSWAPQTDPEAVWRPRDAMVQLAQARGVALFYSGVSGPTTDPSEVTERAQTATQAATRYRMAPGWFVDIVNEPSLVIGQGKSDAAEFREYLKDRYPSLEALRAAWGDELTEGSFDEIAIGPLRGPWSSMRAVDTDRFMSWAMRRWTAETARAVHAGDPGRLVSVGHLPGMGTNEVTWDPIESSYDMDFTDHHYYGDPIGYGPDLMHMDTRTLGKAPSTGEFGNTSHPGLRTHWVYAPEEAANWHYAYVAHTGFGLGAAFVSNWHWQDPIEDIFPCGVLYADGARRPRFETYRNAGILFRTIRPRYEPPEVLFVIPTSHRFGTPKLPIAGAMGRCLQALIAAHVDFGTVAEETLASLPPSAKALMWPVPFCPDDATYGAVLDFVRKGGALYLSGDVSYDPQRKRTRTERLTELCGVEFVSERYPNIEYAASPGQVTGGGDDALSAALREANLAGPCIAVRPTAGEVIAEAADAPVAVLNRVGQGTVLYVTDPVELHAVPRGLLTAFLDRVGVRRHAVDPDAAGIHSHRVHGEKGALAQVLWNLSDQPQAVAISDLPAKLQLTLAPEWGGAAIFGGDRRLIAVEARSASVDGRPLFQTDTSACVISLTGEDVRSASALLILPAGAGALTLAPNEGRDSASVGEVRGGKWTQYERRRLGTGPLRIDGAMSRSLIILGPEARLPELGQRVAKELL